MRFEYQDLKIEAEGDLDRRGRKGTADVPVHFCAVRVSVQIKTDESDEKLERLIELVRKYCPVDSLMQAAVPEYQITWERMA